MAIVRRSPRIAVNHIKSRSKARVATIIARRILLEKEEMMKNSAEANRILRRKLKSAATTNKKKVAIKIVVTPKKERKTTTTTKCSSTPKKQGVVDPASGIQGGSIEILDGEPCDVMLALVNPTQKMDKFYLLQLIYIPKTKTYVTFFRWGRTGTLGQSFTESHKTYQMAVDSFLQKFREKTGIPWSRRDSYHINSNNKYYLAKYYRFVKQNYKSRNGGYKDGKWQYWVDDGVDGKRTGWYDYTPEGSTQTERLFQEHQRNERLSQRLVQSGYFSYNVNFQQMTQTNVTHSNHTTRRIRRVLQ